MIVLYILLAIVVLLFMVLIHEFGHYVVGRMLNFKITEFSIGFGKALFSKRNKRGELISLRLFPLGGYCAFAGEDEVCENKEDAFTNQKPWKRILVFLAGVTFNFATAVIFSLILLCTTGYDIPQFVKYQELNPSNITNMIEGSDYNSVRDNALYSDYQLLPKDVIISIDGKKIDFAYGKNYSDIIKMQVKDLNKWKDSHKDDASFDEKTEFQNNYKPVPALVKRNGEYKNVYLGFTQIEIKNQDKDGNDVYSYSYYWDVNVKAYVHTFGEGLQRAVPFAFGLAWMVLKSLWLLLTFQLPIAEIGGPITTISMIANVTQANLSNILVLIPLISANLAVFNILPIPALDGAHVLFTMIEAIRKKPIKREVENMIHTIGLFILFGLVILIDILHFIL